MLADQPEARKSFQCDQLKELIWIERGSLLYLECYFCCNSVKDVGE